MLVCRTTPRPLSHTSNRPLPRKSQRRELRVTPFPLQLPLFYTTQQCLESSSRFTALLQEQVLRDTTRPESPSFPLLFPPDGLQTISKRVPGRRFVTRPLPVRTRAAVLSRPPRPSLLSCESSAQTAAA